MHRTRCGLLALLRLTPALALWALGSSLGAAQGMEIEAGRLGRPLPLPTPGPQQPPELHGDWQGPYVLTESFTGVALDPTACCSWSGFSHAALLAAGDAAGKVLMFDYLGLYGLWDPAQPAFIDGKLYFQHGVPCALDIFCSGHTAMPDGRLLIAGGNFVNGGCREADCGAAGAPAPHGAVLFDPSDTSGAVSPWVPGPAMAFQRYYPTAVTMTQAFDGRVLVLGGTQESTVPTSAVAPWERLVPGAGAAASCEPGVTTPWVWETIGDPTNGTGFSFYPRMFQLAHPDGRFLIAGETLPRTVSGSYPPGTCWYLTPPAPGAVDGSLVEAPPELERYYGSAVLLHQLPANGGRNRVLMFGGTGGSVSAPDGVQPDNLVVHDSVSEFRFRPGTPDRSDWLPKAPLTEPRAYTNAVVLPTGEIFVSRGSSTDTHHGSSRVEPQLFPELYDPGDSVTPGGGSTRRMQRIPNPYPARVYHSFSLLLPDGRVLVGGGDQVPGGPPANCNQGPQCGQYGTSAYSLEIFEPPYRFQGLSVSIDAAPATLGFGQTFRLDYSLGQGTPAVIDRVVLIKPGSNTHHFDYDQRYIELEFRSVTGPPGGPGEGSGELDVQAPSARLGPPGHYLLFVVLNDGSVRVPSEGRFVRLR